MKNQNMRIRLLGIFPLIFFIARVIEYVRVGTPEHIMWACHISNLLLAAGLFFNLPSLIRIASFWLILGIAPWIGDMIFSKLITPVSIFSHLGGFAVALIAIRRAGLERWSWLHSLIFFLLLQQITRLATPPDPYMNVNVAHFAYGQWKDLFDGYWKYWAVNTALVAAALWIVGMALQLTQTTRHPDEGSISQKAKGKNQKAKGLLPKG